MFVVLIIFNKVIFIFSFFKLCKDLFGGTFTPEYIESLIQETNAFYGGKNIDVDNVVFVHGSDDPWHPMGRLTDVNENSPAFVIDGKKIIIW